ncbi:hypothetical protein ACHHYP_13257 [Achlya hypogyna]|uniref:Secreted protein n=1 Tax=Achlya hypogyna TaxID=1202772 RepID=A0A1V9YFX7_ACHHY|nr:hypothetical protein ACHHYP_13257 [Achlya hypogyna]
MRAPLFLALLAALPALPAMAIDGRQPCDRGVLLEKAGVQTLKACLVAANLTLDMLDAAHAVALCAVPDCVSVVTMASTTTTCPNGQAYAGLCKTTTETPVTVSTSSPTPVATSTSLSPTPAPATTKSVTASSSASAMSVGVTVVGTLGILSLA